MEQNFQTSFIPKKSMIEQPITSKRSVGVLLIISIIIFITMAGISGFVYLYRDTIDKNITQMQVDLSKAKNRFEPSEITKLKTLDKRLQASSEVLSKHIAISPIFEALSSLTLKTVRYTKFSYDFGDNKVQIKMSGQAIGYRSVALQSDMLTKNKNLIDPVFSNLSLDDKGNIIFELQFSVDPSFVDYENFLKTNSNSSSSIGAMQNTGIVN